MRISIFILILVILFFIEFLPFVRITVIEPFTTFLAYLSASVIQLFDSDVQVHGIVIGSIKNNTAVAIKAGCNGVEPVIVLTSAIIAYPSSLKSKLYGIILGFIAIQVINILRIISLFYLLQWDSQWFEWAHLYIWQAVIILDALVIFVIWIRSIASKEGQEVETSIS